MPLDMLADIANPPVKRAVSPYDITLTTGLSVLGVCALLCILYCIYGARGKGPGFLVVHSTSTCLEHFVALIPGR